jgi:hypothetical protein
MRLQTTGLILVSENNTSIIAEESLYKIHLITVRSEENTAVTMKNAVFWGIKTSSYFTGDTLLLRYIAQPVNAM